MTRPLTDDTAGATLSERVSEDLRDRLRKGEWKAGDALPGELHLAKEYAVSRATVRTALQDLESRGLTRSQRGRGTFVTAGSTDLHADLRRLESMSETIARHGKRPGMHYREMALRPANEDERQHLRLPAGSEVLATQRALSADDVVVAFSYDAIPAAILGADFSAAEVGGSLFALLERKGVEAVSAVTELHAAHGDHIGWGDRPADASYLHLLQVHFDEAGRPIAYANTFFVEGRFQFALVRHR